MKNIREIVSKNLIDLRKKNKLTQVELAKKINYSDKAVSRWENGEVMPDLEVINNISEIYNVPISYFFEEHLVSDESTPQKDPLAANKILVGLLSICILWTAIVTVFVSLKVIYGYVFWQSFVWGIPLTCIIINHYNNKWIKSKPLHIISHTIFNWSLITSIFLQLLPYNLWLIFLIGIPIQAATIAATYLKKF